MSLGRGLESLIPQRPVPAEDSKARPSVVAKRGRSQPRSLEVPPEVTEETEALPVLNSDLTSAMAKADKIFNIEIERIKPNPYQPRRDFNTAEIKNLADSMREYGMLQPLLVSKVETNVASGTKVEYQLIAGERRLRAAEMAGLRQVPAIIRSASEAGKLEMAVVENIQRRDLNPIEESVALCQMISEFGLTHEQLAKKVGMSAVAVSNKVRLVGLPQDVKELIIQAKLSEGQAKALLGTKNPERQRYFAKKAMNGGMTVRMLEDLIRYEPDHRPVSVPASSDPSMAEYQRLMREFLGTTVKIVGTRYHGHLNVSFSSEEDLAKLVEKLTGQAGIKGGAGMSTHEA
ncbi:MAG: ParB/RepB/Spo0J family partition protein [Parcubacteria group bacterium]|nr:ParB/RepB/Spo0J family partition protein [Parcubacteria group bacterium]